MEKLVQESLDDFLGKNKEEERISISTPGNTIVTEGEIGHGDLEKMTLKAGNTVIEGDLRVKGKIYVDEVGTAKDWVAESDQRLMEPMNECAPPEPMITLRKYTELGDMCFDLLEQLQELGDDVRGNRDEIWKFIDERLKQYNAKIESGDYNAGAPLNPNFNPF